MPLPPIISCLIEIQNGLRFWCRLTQVVLEKRPLDGYNVFEYVTKTQNNVAYNISYFELHFTGERTNERFILGSMSHAWLIALVHVRVGAIPKCFRDMYRTVALLNVLFSLI